MIPKQVSAYGGYAIVSAARPGLDEDDFWQAMIIAERCFQSAQDAFQMPIEESTIGWIRATIPAHWHLIQHQGKVIGSTLLMPTSSAVMAAFLAGALTEAGLFASARQTCPHSADCGYWAGTSVMETHRRRGLGLASLNAALQAFIAHEHPQPTFYYWSYSAAGQRLAQHWRPALAQQGLRLLERREPDSERHDRLSTQGCPDVE